MPKITQIPPWMPEEKRLEYFLKANDHMDIKIEGNIMYIRYLEHEDYVEINLDEFLKAPVCYTAIKVSYDTETHEAVTIPTKIIGNTHKLVKGEEKDKIITELEKCNEEILKGKQRELFPLDNVTNENRDFLNTFKKCCDTIDG